MRTPSLYPEAQLTNGITTRIRWGRPKAFRGDSGKKKSGAAVSTPDGKRNLEEGLSMIPLSITVNHALPESKFQKLMSNAEKAPYASPTPLTAPSPLLKGRNGELQTIQQLECRSNSTRNRLSGRFPGLGGRTLPWQRPATPCRRATKYSRSRSGVSTLAYQLTYLWSTFRSALKSKEF